MSQTPSSWDPTMSYQASPSLEALRRHYGLHEEDDTTPSPPPFFSSPLPNTSFMKDEEFEEEDFNSEFVRCTLRMMPVKKSESAGDRVVRFLGTFLNAASQKDNELLSEDDTEETSVPETPTSRLTTKLLSTLLPLLQVKDKTIRFRATQMTSH